MLKKQKIEKWEDLCAKSKECKACGLHLKSNSKVICDPPHYDGLKDVLFIGDSPTDIDMQNGLPFTDPHGVFLRDLIRSTNLPRDMYAFTNIVMCKTSSGEDPKSSEIQQCKKWLIEKINMLKPLAIVTVGKVSAETMLGRKVSMMAISGYPKRTNLTYGSITIDLPMMALPTALWGKGHEGKYEKFIAIMDSWLKSVDVTERDPKLA